MKHVVQLNNIGILTFIIWKNRKESRLVQKYHQCITKMANKRKPVSKNKTCVQDPSPKMIYSVLVKKKKGREGNYTFWNGLEKVRFKVFSIKISILFCLCNGLEKKSKYVVRWNLTYKKLHWSHQISPWNRLLNKGFRGTCPNRGPCAASSSNNLCNSTS